ncbi:glycoside hydrolase family 16 protein [Cellulophaga baltica]|uniref:glycoside hydrolase family 16 protein n=1 Tax=Cellulophaga TaxID=104264 RepID=UPI001C06EBBE|nr:MULTISPECIES: glycoside hydrolase family 16 protein [Cellulophaga]MBU2996932.1 glycoside hydrolase family 16 protein [Cellulophaga baltica]MDO6768330.1 glycoside hydrolase family 16 protein [Cellulophaga sp. 1_MG-2023]
MKLSAKFTFLVLSIVSFSCAQEKKMVWEENFDGDTLNEEVWNFELGDGCPNICGWGNNEKQVYTKTNHTLKDGFLHIKVKKEDGIYTSTRITTAGKKKFKYGKIEARAKITLTKGLWPAFWMLGANINEVGWPKSGEIDILEYIGKKPDSVFTSLHFPDHWGGNAYTKTTEVKNVEEGFHNYAINWTPDIIEFFIDDIKVFEYQVEEKTEENWPFDQPFYFILNTAVGGNLGGSEIDDSDLPEDFVIDYIRVYEN